MSEHTKLPNIVAAMKWLDAFDSCVYSGPEWAAEHARTIKAEIERLRSLALDDARFDAAQLSRENVAMADERVALRAALIEAERFLDYFANGHTTFVGRGTPNSALAMVRAAIAGDPGCLRSPAPAEDKKSLLGRTRLPTPKEAADDQDGGCVQRPSPDRVLPAEGGEGAREALTVALSRLEGAAKCFRANNLKGLADNVDLDIRDINEMFALSSGRDGGKT